VVEGVAEATGLSGRFAGWPSQCLQGYGSTRQNDGGLTALSVSQREPAASFCGSQSGVGVSGPLRRVTVATSGGTLCVSGCSAPA